MNDVISEEEYKGYTIQLVSDDYPESPREWDNLGTMICFHNRYELGDKHELNSEDFDGWDELQKYLVKEKGAVLISPLYLYDHSGLRIKIGSFRGLLPQGHAEFDSGQVGFVYVSREKILKEYGVKKITQKVLKRAEGVLEAEVKNYDIFLMGGITGFVIVDADGEHIDSCYGFYSDEDAITEAKGIIDYKVKEAQQKHEAQLKAYIKNHVQLDYRFSK